MSEYANSASGDDSSTPADAISIDGSIQSFSGSTPPAVSSPQAETQSDHSDEDEEDDDDRSDSGSRSSSRSASGEVDDEDIDRDLFDDHDDIDGADDFGPSYDSDLDADDWRQHLHHHYHHHHHHGHGFPGTHADSHNPAHDEEESLFVDDAPDFDDIFGGLIGPDDLDAFELLSAFGADHSPPAPGLSNGGPTPLREILEAAAVFGAESLFHESPRDQHSTHSIRDFFRDQRQIPRPDNRRSSTSNNTMSRSSRGGGDELVRLELGGGGGGSRAQRSQRNQRPSQGPSGSAEVIDLTLDDGDAAPEPVLPFPRPIPPQRPPRANSRRSAQRSVPPPNLTRSDTRYVDDGPQVINLVSDSEDDNPTTTHVRTSNGAGSRSAGRRHNPVRAAASSSRPAPVEPPPQPWGLNAMQNIFFPFMARRSNHVAPPDGHDDIAILAQRNISNNPHAGHRHHNLAAALGIAGFPSIDLNYTAHPFHPRQAAQPPPKPKHEPPKPAREGFTRDTGDEFVAICPSCEEELAYDPDGDDAADAAGPPAKKARTRRDKAEHHFFAVKGCGHVYCKRCYENRGNTTRNVSYTSFIRPSSSDGRAGKKTYCAVEGCEEEVGNKSAWVGIFL